MPEITDKEAHKLIDKLGCDRADTIIIIHRKPNDWMKAVVAHKEEANGQIVYTLVTDSGADNWRQLLASDAWKREPIPVPLNLTAAQKLEFLKSMYLTKP